MVTAAATSIDSNKSDKDIRKKMRLDGRHGLVEVAKLICGDVRLSPLLADLNPSLASSGALPSGTIVVCPSKNEAHAFAKKMGFTVGFDEQSDNGTGARRKWNSLVGARVAHVAVDGEALALSLIARAVSPAEAGRRLARACSESDIASLLRSSDASIRETALHAEAHALYPKAISRIVAVRSILDATCRPAGLLALIDALAKDAVASDKLLAACAVAPALRQVLAREAPRVKALLTRGKELAALERGARDITVKQDEDAASLRKIVDAFVDGVDAIAGDRAEALGLADELDALVKHLEMLRGALAQAEKALGRQGAGVIRSLARGGDGAGLPKPWPLLCQVVRDVSAAMELVPATALDAGLGGLRKRGQSAEGAAVRLTVAELQVRAASCARAVDEGAAFSERLAPVVVELFGLMRPPPAVDGGTAHAKKARRRSAFDVAMAAKGDVGADGIAAIAKDVVERARSGGDAAAMRLNKQQMIAIDEVARQIDGPLSIQRQPMSELGRALVVAAMALDREVAQGLSRPTGREAFVAAAIKHAGRVVSAASCAIGR